MNFTLDEFNCHDGTDVPTELIPNVEELITNLQVLRDEIKVPITILSGYRSPAWNKHVNGKPNSFHMRGMASDLQTSLTPKELKAVIERLIKEKKMKPGGIGLYPTFVHYDIRGYNARW